MHAVTIIGRPECVWPWLVKMGSGRARWYSYDWLDNDGDPSATEIISALQRITPGDVMPLLPGVKDSFIVGAVDPERDLILTVPAVSGGLLVSWEFFLAKNAQRSKTVTVSSSDLPEHDKRPNRPALLKKTAFCQKLLPGKVATLAISTHPKAPPKGRNVTSSRMSAEL
jgi:hypothetical protein